MEGTNHERTYHELTCHKSGYPDQEHFNVHTSGQLSIINAEPPKFYFSYANKYILLYNGDT